LGRHCVGEEAGKRSGARWRGDRAHALQGRGGRGKDGRGGGARVNRRPP
jgi:hypothetical protein